MTLPASGLLMYYEVAGSRRQWQSAKRTDEQMPVRQSDSAGMHEFHSMVRHKAAYGYGSCYG